MRLAALDEIVMLILPALILPALILPALILPALILPAPQALRPKCANRRVGGSDQLAAVHVATSVQY